MLWVHATLVESSLAVYGRFVRCLSGEEQEAYYREMVLVARLFGTPADVIPCSLGEFRDYLSARLTSGEICVTAPARQVAEVIVQPPLPAPLCLLAPAHRLSTAAMLPVRLRQEYGLRFTAPHGLALRVAARSMRVASVPLFLAAERLSPPGFALAAS